MPTCPKCGKATWIMYRAGQNVEICLDSTNCDFKRILDSDEEKVELENKDVGC